MKTESRVCSDPYFSICIPQHNRTDFLIEALKSLQDQTFDRFEVCISDGGSTDGKQGKLLSFLESSGLSFVYDQADRRMRYDENTRNAIGLAKGEYCFLLGNDDALKDAGTLEFLHEKIEMHQRPAWVVTNYEDWASGDPYRRVTAERLLPGGPDTCIRTFRNLSFVSGLLCDRAEAQRHATDKWDGSEMYQMFLYGRLVGGGGNLLEEPTSCIRKDIQITGQQVDSYATKPKEETSPGQLLDLPMIRLGQVVGDGVLPFLPEGNKTKYLELIFTQLYSFTYAFWMFEFRRVRSWAYTYLFCRSIRPARTIGSLPISTWGKIKIRALYFGMCLFGLCTPLPLFDAMKGFFYKLAKSLFRNRAAAH